MKPFYQFSTIFLFLWKQKFSKLGLLLFLVFEIVVALNFYRFAKLIVKLQIPAKNTGQTSNDLEQMKQINTGNLNLHLWMETCPKSLDFLCNFPMFPNAPDNRLLVNKTKVDDGLEKVEGMRILGFIVPRETGSYIFWVQFCSAEVWLSQDENWKNARKILNAGKLSQNKKDVQVSTEINLIAGQKYFIDVVATCFWIRKKFQLLWKTPKSSYFEIINGTFLSHYVDDRDFNGSKIYDELLPDSLVCASRRNNTTYFPIEREISYLSHDEVKDILPYCEYNASYTVNKRVKRYHAVRFHVVHTFVYPFFEHPNLGYFGQKYPLNENEALEVVHIFAESLEKTLPG